MTEVQDQPTAPAGRQRRTRRRRNRLLLALLAAFAVTAAAAAVVYAALPPAGRLVEDISFETGDLSQLSGKEQATEGRIAVVRKPVEQGRYSVRFELRNGDRWHGDVGKSRAEATIGPQVGYAPRNGGDYWHRFSFLVPRGTPLSSQVGDSLHITQSWAVDLSGFFAGLTFRHDALTFDNRSGEVWRMPIRAVRRNHWYTILWHSHYSKDPSRGFDELWVDGREAGKRYAQTFSRTGSTNYFKFGLYRMDHGQGTARIFFDDLRVGTSRAQVDPSWFDRLLGRAPA